MIIIIYNYNLNHSLNENFKNEPLEYTSKNNYYKNKGKNKSFLSFSNCIVKKIKHFIYILKYKNGLQ